MSNQHLVSPLLKDNEYNSFEIAKLENSRYINPYRINFNHNGKKRIWDGIMSHASVSCVLFNTDKQSIILVRQFRPVVHVQQVLEAQNIDLMKPDGSFESKIDWSKVNVSDAFTFELCAGILFGL
jgi:UDP-sugar diphosphatase